MSIHIFTPLQVFCRWVSSKLIEAGPIRCVIDLFMDIRFESVQSPCRCESHRECHFPQKLFHRSIFLGVPVCSDITFLIHQPSSLLAKKLDTVFRTDIFRLKSFFFELPPSNSCPYILRIKDVLFNFQYVPGPSKNDFHLNSLKRTTQPHQRHQPEDARSILKPPPNLSHYCSYKPRPFSSKSSIHIKRLA